MKKIILSTILMLSLILVVPSYAAKNDLNNNSPTNTNPGGTTIQLTKDTAGTTQEADIDDIAAGNDATQSTVPNNSWGTSPTPTPIPQIVRTEREPASPAYVKKSRTLESRCYWVVYEAKSNNVLTIDNTFDFKYIFKAVGTYRIEKHRIDLIYYWLDAYERTLVKEYDANNKLVKQYYDIGNFLYSTPGHEKSVVDPQYNYEIRTMDRQILLATIDTSKMGYNLSSNSNTAVILYPYIAYPKPLYWNIVITKDDLGYTWDENTPQQNTAPDVDGSLIG